jgi:hypothetical protein
MKYRIFVCLFFVLPVVAAAEDPTGCLQSEQQQEFQQKVSKLSATFEVTSIATEMRQLMPQIQESLDKEHQCRAHLPLFGVDPCSKEADTHKFLTMRYDALESQMRTFNETLQTQLSILRAAYPAGSR